MEYRWIYRVHVPRRSFPTSLCPRSGNAAHMEGEFHFAFLLNTNGTTVFTQEKWRPSMKQARRGIYVAMADFTEVVTTWTARKRTYRSECHI